jgi:molybdenum cofactor cytidylyltransferase
MLAIDAASSVRAIPKRIFDMALSIVANMTKPGGERRAQIACVLLAAGGSSRLGQPKQLVRRGNRPLLLHALAAARGALGRDAATVVVLGAAALRLRNVLQRSAPNGAASVAYNALWRAGLAGSLRVGLDALPRTARAALVTLVDQPNVDAGALRRLIAAWRARPGVPAAAHYAGRAGVPAILPRRLWQAARGLEGDAGARALLRSAPTVTLVEMPEAELDIDTAEDLARL